MPGNERRNADGNNLTYLVDQTWLPANFGTPNEVDGEPAIDASFDTWNNIKKNTKLDIVKVPDTGEQPSAFFVEGDPTDINNDGYADTALKEVWI